MKYAKTKKLDEALEEHGATKRLVTNYIISEEIHRVVSN